MIADCGCGECYYNEALTGANIHYGGIGDIFYVVPAFDGTNVTVTMKGSKADYVFTATDGVFQKANTPIGVYRVYAKQKNGLTIFLGEYNNAPGEFVNTKAFTLPAGDVNADDVIDIADLSMLLATGNYGEANTEIDLTGDEIITIDDISLVLKATNFGMSSAKIV